MFYFILTTRDVGLNYYSQFIDENAEKFSDFTQDYIAENSGSPECLYLKAS